MPSSSIPPASSEPSLIHGHALLAKGLAEETIGTTFNAPTWTASGTTDKALGIAEIHAADDNSASSSSAHRPAAAGPGGKVEGFLGDVVGCPGMKERGEEKVAAANNVRQ
ncbi:hypothetical protein HKX48_001666 [Thoreauomyces humboldtii]|nr:hypothetical protein HKX48_001666 [Thoreauomyces humboldtii]